MGESPSGVRHAARGCLNAIKLCVSALELPGPEEEQIEFLDDVIRSSDKMCGLVEQLNSLFEQSAEAEPDATRLA